VQVAEVVKRCMGDVGALCLPGYGLPLARILLKEEEMNALFSHKTFFTEREERFNNL